MSVLQEAEGMLGTWASLSETYPYSPSISQLTPLETLPSCRRRNCNHCHAAQGPGP